MPYGNDDKRRKEGCPNSTDYVIPEARTKPAAGILFINECNIGNFLKIIYAWVYFLLNLFLENSIIGIFVDLYLQTAIKL